MLRISTDNLSCYEEKHRNIYEGLNNTCVINHFFLRDSFQNKFSKYFISVFYFYEIYSTRFFHQLFNNKFLRYFQNPHNAQNCN